MAALGMPLAQERLIDVDRNGVARPTRAWYLFWQKLSQQAAAGGVSPADFSALLIYLGSSDGTLAGLPPFNPGGGLPANANVLGSQSVETTGALSAGIVLVNLVNDVDLPAPTTYYGADGIGEKGWFPIADAFAAQPEITLTVGADGVTTISITPVPDSGAGALLAITRNGLGQVTGTRPATITGTAGRITVANGDASAGLPTIDLETVPATAGGVFRIFDVDGFGRVSARTSRAITGTAGQIAVTNGTGAAGDPTVALVAVPNAGGGTLQKTAFDAWGRATGYSAATTDDLSEGSSNQWFTNERAQDAVGTILTNSPSVLFTYDDAGNKITAESPQWIFGQEYLYAFHQKLIAGTSASMLFSGDSTTLGTGIANTNYLLHNAVLRIGRARRHVLTATNAGHSGASTEDWRTTYVAGDVAANPDLMVLRWGLNDPFYGRNLAQFETSLRAGLTTIRSSKTVGQMSVVLMTPSTANDPPNGRTPAWIESTRAVIRKAARDFQCTFIDTFKLWEDTVNASGNWMDNPFGDGRPLHPLEAMNGWIASKIAEVIFPAADDPTKTSVRATMSADVTFPTGAFSTIVYDVEAEDSRGEYNPATGVFTPQQAGRYLFNAAAYFDMNGENRSVIVSVSVNGSETVRLCEVPYYGTVMVTGGISGGTMMLNLAAGDVVRIQSFVFSQSGGLTYKLKNYPYTTFLKIFRLE